MKEKRRDMGNDLYLAVFILLIKFSHASINEIKCSTLRYKNEKNLLMQCLI